MDGDFDNRVEAIVNEIEGLKNEITKKRVKDETFSKVALRNPTTNEIRKKSTKACRTLKGHFGKVYALQWSGDSQRIVSASQGGQLIVWNANTTNKLNSIELKTSWVMSCAIDQKRGSLVACGGLDNMCSVFRVNSGFSENSSMSQDPSKNKLVSELLEHDGYISCCRFVGENTILTASGDSTAILWDYEKTKILNTFNDHDGDVMFISMNPTDPNMFVTGSIDKRAKVWDIRTGKCTQTHFGHDSDVNSVSFFPDGLAFASGSEDSTARLFDLRSFGEVKRFGGGAFQPVTSVDLSKSGRLLFAGCVDNLAYGFDVLNGGVSPILNFTSSGHEKRVTCLEVSPKGDGLCTGSWDSTLKIWA